MDNSEVDTSESCTVQGRSIYVKGGLGAVEVMCDSSFMVEDVKAEAACYPDWKAVEDQTMVFCGRVLENAHTLGEYNVQKPCVLTVTTGTEVNAKGVGKFIETTYPERWTLLVLNPNHKV